MRENNTANKKIFIVDDSDIILTQARKYLKDRFIVQTFNAATKMLKIARTIPVFPDMILLDIEMPDMHGSDALCHIRDIPIWRDVPVLLMTSWDSDMILEHFFELGALDVIHKPLIPSVMLNRVEKYLIMSESFTAISRPRYQITNEEKVALTRAR